MNQRASTTLVANWMAKEAYCETMAQTAAVMVGTSMGLVNNDLLVYFMAIDGCKFRRKVVPGDVLEMYVETTRGKPGGKVWKFKGVAKVEGEMAAEAEFTAMGLTFVPSAANFVLVHVGDGDAVFKTLLRRGLIVRAMRSYKLPAWIRVSVGTMEQNRAFIKNLRALDQEGLLKKGEPLAA